MLLVEDEFLIAMELEAVLQRCGCEVLGPASSVRQALAVLDDTRPEVAVLDVNLRGQRATPVAAVLQERGVPFVLMTGYSELQLSEPELRGAPNRQAGQQSGAAPRPVRAIDGAGTRSTRPPGVPRGFRTARRGGDASPSREAGRRGSAGGIDTRITDLRHRGVKSVASGRDAAWRPLRAKRAGGSRS